jgi:hypothetical protein
VSCCGCKKEPKADGGVVDDMKRDLKNVGLNERAGLFKTLAVKTYSRSRSLL